MIEEDQFVVLKGSAVVLDNRPSANTAIKRMREKLIIKIY